MSTVKSVTLFFLKDALRHWVKQTSEQNALVPVCVFSVNNFMPVFWHHAHTMYCVPPSSPPSPANSTRARMFKEFDIQKIRRQTGRQMERLTDR